MEQKLHELDSEISKRHQSRDGLQKLLTVYTQNPAMGNATDVDRQMSEIQKEIEHLQDQHTRYHRLLQDAQTEINLPLNGGSSPHVQSQTSLNGFNSKRTSYSEESVSSEGSAVTGMAKRLNGINCEFYLYLLSFSYLVHGSSGGSVLNASGFNGHNMSGTTTTANSSLANIPHIDGSETASNSNGSETNIPASTTTGSAEIYEDHDGGDTLPILGTCKALYPFEGTSGDGTTISMQTNDKLYLLEKDDGDGDGWTRVRHAQTSFEGFVPTSYLECHWH